MRNGRLSQINPFTTEYTDNTEEIIIFNTSEVSRFRAFRVFRGEMFGLSHLDEFP